MHAVCRIMSKLDPTFLKRLTISEFLMNYNDFLIYQISIEFRIRNTLLHMFHDKHYLFQSIQSVYSEIWKMICGV